MGGERLRTGKHIYFSTAGLIMLLAAACVPGTHAFRDHDVCGHINNADVMIGRGDFDSAAKVYLDILARSPKSPLCDVALFNLGLISAHYANPKKDYKKALVFFTRVDRDFSGSPLGEEARIWAGVLQSLEKANQVDIEIQQKKMGLGR